MKVGDLVKIDLLISYDIETDYGIVMDVYDKWDIYNYDDVAYDASITWCKIFWINNNKSCIEYITEEKIEDLTLVQSAREEE